MVIKSKKLVCGVGDNDLPGFSKNVKVRTGITSLPERILKFSNRNNHHMRT